MKMSKPFEITRKQAKYIKFANKRYNIKTGAVRSGKTFLDYFMIPQRINAVKGERGEVVILGNTRSSIERNIIRPMQREWGYGHISGISSNNTVKMFGETVHVLGAEKANMEEKIRGMSIKYAYGDEVVGWSPNVWRQVHARLDEEYSIFDGTCNPEHPQHWFKTGFLDNEDMKKHMFHQHYELDDNEFLPESVRESIKDSYRGTILYDRLVLGKWTRAEGLIYSRYANNPEAYNISQLEIPLLREIIIGMDFGGNKSKHAMVATGFANNYRDIYALASRRIEPNLSPDELAEEYVRFLLEIEYKYKIRVNYTYADSASQPDMISMRIALQRNGLQRQVVNSIKGEVIDRISLELILFNQKRIWFTEDTETLQAAFLEATWSPKVHAQERLDDGSSDIDSLDAFEYSFTPRMGWLTEAGRI